MTYLEFLDKVINEGIRAAAEEHENRPGRRDGAVAAFEACRGKTPEELLEVYRKAEITRSEQAVAYRKHINEKGVPPTGRHAYGYYLSFVAEVERVLDIVSAMFWISGAKPLVTPTAWGRAHAERILAGRKPN